MPTTEYFKSLAPGVSLRVRYTSDRNTVEHFIVRLEIYTEDTWRPVVRYDNAHGEAHIDYLDPKGVTYRKDWLNIRWPFNAALDEAKEELQESYQRHIDRFMAQREFH